MPMISPDADWDVVFAKLRAAAPEAFTSAGRVLNLIRGEWTEPGFGRHYEFCVDGRSLGRIPMVDLEGAKSAVKFSKSEAATWQAVDLAERRRRVIACLEGMREYRDLFAHLLIWEIGKPFAQALTVWDRCLDGVEWYVENIN